MFRRSVWFAVPLMAALHCPAARASVYSDDLGKCLVKMTSGDDRILLMQWMFSALSLHPAVRPLVSITPEQRHSFNKQVAALFLRLLGVDCRKEAVDALKYDGTSAVGGAFQLLGQISARDLMTQEDVAAAMGNVGKYLDQDESFKTLLKDAGVSEAPQAQPAPK